MSGSTRRVRLLAASVLAAVTVGVVAAILVLRDDDPGIRYASFSGPTYNSLKELAAASDLVVVGTVTGVAARGEDYGTTDRDVLADYERAGVPPRPLVFYEIAVSETLKGQHTTPIFVRGLDAERLIAAEISVLRAGERVLLFLRGRERPPGLRFTESSLPTDQTTYITLGLDNGVFDISDTGTVRPRMPQRFTTGTLPTSLDGMRTRLQNISSAPTPDTGNGGSVSSQGVARELPADTVELDRCDDMATIASRLEGSLGARQNPDPIVMDVVGAYRDEHPDTYGGRWIDRENGVVVVAFTDNPEAHREAILARAPSPDDHPSADPRPVGERENVTIDVVQVRYSQAELEAIQQQIRDAASGRDLAESMLSVIHIRKNRVRLDLLNPPEGALEELKELVPDPAAVCVSVYYTPRPPTGPLDVIPDLDVEDPLVACHRSIPPVRYSQLIDPPPIDEVDHPAVDALRAELEAPGTEPMPRGRWVVISIDDDLATFAALSSDSFGYARFERRGDKWLLGGMGSGRPCEPTVALPEGLNRVEVRLDPDSPPNPHSNTIDVLVTEAACASGREMDDALLGPQVVETDTAVIVAFAAIPLYDRLVKCPGNPSTPVTIELSQPLGNRTIYDGLYVPPKPLGGWSKTVGSNGPSSSE